MTKFQAEIDVMPKKEILDPQGKSGNGQHEEPGPGRNTKCTHRKTHFVGN